MTKIRDTEQVLSDASYEVECGECGNSYDILGSEILEAFDLELASANFHELIKEDADFHLDNCPWCAPL